MVMNDKDQLRRAAETLRRALADEDGVAEHLLYEQIEAYVDGRLDEVDREIVQAHLEDCRLCAEDRADLEATKAQLSGGVPTRRVPRFTWIAAAAGIVLAVVLWQVSRVHEPPPSRSAQTVPISSPASADTPTKNDDGLLDEERAAINRALSSGTLAVPSSVRALTGAEGTLLGGATDAGEMRPLSPAGTAVATDAPAFTWQPLAGATSYSVAVFDEEFRGVASSGSLQTTSWTPSPALPRGRVLTWQVKATRADGSTVLAPAPPHPEARFVVLDAGAAARIDAARTRLVARPLDLAVVLADAGLVADAERELKRAAASPDTAAAAAKLLDSLKR
jgi:hypothetical protein